MNFDDFKNSLIEYNPNQVVFIGLGNELRGDDAAGLIFIDYLSAKKEFENSVFIKAGTNPENYLQNIIDTAPSLIVFVDAANFYGSPGEIKWLDSNDIDSINISTHAFSIKMVEDFLLSEIETEFKYLGIEPLTTEFNKPISKEVTSSLENFFG